MSWRVAAAVPLVLWGVGSLPVQAAPASGPITLRIESQPIAAALNEWALQTGYMILMPTDGGAKSLVTPRVDGTMTPENAVQLLLSNSGLSYVFVNPRTLSIRAAPSSLAGTSALIAAESLTREVPKPLRSVSIDGDLGGGAGETRDGHGASLRGARSLEEVVVTAQKRRERLIDVPMSVVAVTSTELKARRIGGLDDLRLVVPGLAVNSDGLQRRIYLRGISNVSGSTSPVGIYIDEASIPSASPDTNVDLRALDLERVEVLRGPQGTLFGEGSLGGAIRLITRNPELDRFGGGFDMSGSYTLDGDPSQHVQGVLNMPFVEDVLGVRVAALHDEQGGWIDQPGAGQDFNDQELQHARAKVLWKPTQQLTALAMSNFHRNDAGASGGEDEHGNFTQPFGLLTEPIAHEEYELHNLTLTYEFGGVELLSSSSYSDQLHRHHNFGACIQNRDPALSSCRSSYHNEYLQKTMVFNQELRLTSSRDGRFQWTVGGFYLDMKGNGKLDQIVGSNGINQGNELGLATTAIAFTRGRSSSWAVFANASYDVTERLEAGAGVRYFADDREAFGVPAIINGTPQNIAPNRQQRVFHAVSPKLYASYALMQNARIYASATKGFRSGGFNALGNPPYDPEELWSYELGAKLAAGDFTADIALFYSDYGGYQISGLLPSSPMGTTSITRNAGDVEIQGIDWAFAWQATDALSLSFNGNYVDTELVELDLANTRMTVGDPALYVPEYLATFAARYEFDWLGRRGEVRLDYSRLGKSLYFDRSVSSPWLQYSESDLIDMLDIGASYRLRDNVSLGVFGRNLLDEDGHLNANAILGRAPRPRPRTVGIELGVDF